MKLIKVLFLGNKINFEKMIVELIEENEEMIYEKCFLLMSKNYVKIRIVVWVIGFIILSFLVIELG